MSVAPPQTVDWQGAVSDAWTTIATFVPKLLFFGIVRRARRGKQALAKCKYDASDIVAKLVKYQEQYDGAGRSSGPTTATYAERPVDLRASDPSAETRQI
jgi:hypothetical protein